MEMMQSGKSKTVRGACLVGLGAVAVALAAFPPADGDERLLAGCDTLFVDCGDTHTLTANEEYDYVFIGQGGAVYTGGYTLKIKAAGGLLIEGAGLLNVSGAGGKVDLAGGGTHVIDGQVGLSTSTSVLEISTHAILGGAGRIKGFVAGAEVSVDSTKTLISQMRIEGILTIAGTSDATTGKFVNRGLVIADSASARILLEDLTYTGYGQWQVGPTSGTEIEFASDAKATQLWGDFTVLDGTLDVNANVITSGHLHWVDGTIDVASSVEFRAN